MTKIDWSELLLNFDKVDAKLDIFYQTLMPIIHTPMHKTRDSHYPIWYTAPLLRALKEKAKIHHKCKKYNNPMDKLTYELLRERCKVMIKFCYENFKKRVTESIRGDPNYFWKFFKHRRKNTTNCIPNEIIQNDHIIKGLKDICDAFAKHLFCYLCKINWNEVLSADSIDRVIEILYSILNETINNYITIKAKFNSNFPVWYSKSLTHIVKEKLLKDKRWKEGKNPRDYDDFALPRTRQKSVQKKCYYSYTHRM
ncbi:jg3025 [Pararge aegeria aegeria]|uniref:Jg3025 protein n=1 Tax=Pararge aegeria aegeria TaxID=348720 RepID=A0A8S4QJV5_9NEOP|nr:jg3025 [Pararge aegeria aegeria]